MKNNAPDFISDEEMNAELSKNAPDFISDADFESEELKPYNELQTFGANALDTFTLDHAPNLISAAQNMSFSSPEYITDRDTSRERLELGKEENPISRYAGATVGIAAPLAATLLTGGAAPAAAGGAATAIEGANVAKTVAPSLLKTAAKNLAINEAMTGLQNPGDVKGQASGLQLEERFNNMTDPMNMGVNVATAGLAGVTSNKLKNMQSNQDTLAYKSLSPAAKNTEIAINLNQDEITPDRASRIGEFIKNTGILKGSPDIVEIAGRTKQKLQNLGENIGNILSKNDSKIKYNTPTGVFDSYDGIKLVDALNRKHEGNGELAQTVMNEINSIIDDRIKFSDGNVKFSDLNKVRQNIQKKVNYDRLYTSDLEQTKNEMYNDAAKYFNDLIEQEVQKHKGVLGESALKELKIANSQYSLMSEANKIASKAASKVENSNNAQNFLQSILPGITTGSVVGGITHSPMAALSTAAATMGAQAAIPRANAMAANIAAGSLPRASRGFNESLRYGINPMMNQAPLIEPPPPTPQEMERQIKNDPNMTTSEKAKARNEIRKGAR